MSGLDRQLAEIGGEITPALENVLLPAALLDQNGVIRWQNRASIEAVGDAVGSSISSVVAPQERREAHELLTRILCSGEPADFTMHVRVAADGYARYEISAVPMRDGGSVVGMFGLGRRLGAAGSRRSGGSGTPAVELTQRQRDVLYLLAEGRSTGEIASELDLSATTVRNHIAGLIAALGVHTRLQAVVAAHRSGLLDLSS